MKTPIETMLDQVELTPVEYTGGSTEGLPYVTHEGKMQIGDISLTVYVLNTGQRIIPAEELEAFFANGMGFANDK